MAVGYKGISVVLRGDRLGVFRATNDGKMELGGTVNQIKGPKNGKTFEPKKVCVFHSWESPIIYLITLKDHAPQPRP